MKNLILLTALASCTPANWTKKDQGLEGVELVLLATDWGQTVQDVVPNCNEANPIIGECGERLRPGVYFPVIIATTMVVTRLPPENLRSVFQGAMIGAETATVWDNWRKY